MRLLTGLCICTLIMADMMACTPTWNHTSGPQVLSPAYYKLPANMGDTWNSFKSGRVSFTVPDGWHWFIRGDDLIATREGVFLQQIFIERLHVEQVSQEVSGAFPLAALSSKQWPIRTAKSLTMRFATGMALADAVEVLLESRRNDPSITDFEVSNVVTQTIAEHQAFRAVFDFRLKSEDGPSPEYLSDCGFWQGYCYKPAAGPLPLYRSIYCGFMYGDWFYGISYTAAVRFYFDRDVSTFETFLKSVRLVD